MHPAERRVQAAGIGMPEASAPRRGLQQGPGGVPPLPGSGTRSQAPAAVPAPQPPDTSSLARRGLRAREFQLDKAARDWVDTTAFAIRLRTERAFDGSALMRAILAALLRSGLEVADRCESEEDVTEYVLGNLSRKSS